MQRSSTRFICGMWKRATMMPQATQLKFARRQMANYGGSNKSPPKTGTTTSSSSSSRSPTSPTAGANQRSRVRVDTSTPRQIMREDNMWNDPGRLDTKWLRSRDPRRYKPDFGQTEPHSLRKQFMRSPDERTRDAMSRDWEVAMRVADNRRRQAIIAKQRQDLEQASMKAEKELQGAAKKKYERKTAKDVARDLPENKKK